MQKGFTKDAQEAAARVSDLFFCFVAQLTHTSPQHTPRRKQQPVLSVMILCVSLLGVNDWHKNLPELF